MFAMIFYRIYKIFSIYNIKYSYNIKSGCKKLEIHEYLFLKEMET